MANNLVSMQHIRVLIQHLIKGFSQRRIALELQLSRNTVKQYVERLLASEMGYDALLKTDDATLSTIIYCLLYTSPSPRDRTRSRMPSSA